MQSGSNVIYVLVVDDEDVIRSLFTDLLTDRGYKVIAVRNGQQAVEKVREINFTIAFIDMHMPMLNGIETLKAIKKIRRQMSIVMMDSYPNCLLEQAESGGALRCIHKPFEIKEVIEIMEEFVEQKA
jgi:two-component system NtrC family response regulator/two-component system nitrogen regulation response regulator GlnG